MILNIPDTRQRALEQRLANGEQIVAAEVAVEFAVSLDTIRRDILSLEAIGKAHRVRGGAVPVAQPASPLFTRISAGHVTNPLLIMRTIELIGDAATLIMDGGSTTLAVARRLPAIAGRLVITPSPWVAITCHENGIDVFVLGGKLSALGGIGVGEHALDRTATISADIAILGACGLDAEFGLSSDDFDESNMKKMMQAAASRTFVVTDGTKIGRRARYKTLSLDEIDIVITDAKEDRTNSFLAAGGTIESV